jgi:flagellar hook-associated protein 3 FlgL
MPGFRALGDLSTAFLLSRQTHALKSEVQRRSTELGSGQTANKSQTLRGDYRALAAIERGLGIAGAEKLAISEAQGFASVAQVALGMVQDQADVVTGALLSIPYAPTSATVDRAGQTVRQAFGALVGALNKTSADRAIFAGDATDGAALAAVSVMMADIEALVAGETTAAGVAAAVNAWFDTPGTGFDALGYTGSNTPLAPVRLGQGETADLSLTAADPGLREMMKGFAMGALLDGPVLGGDVSERVTLARIAAETALNAKGLVTDLQAGIGSSEAAIETARVRSSAEVSTLELARHGLIGIDPFETATRLETAQTQLETLFALTARVSRLSLADFL